MFAMIRLLTAVAGIALLTSGGAAQTAGKSCDNYLPQPRQVNGRAVGPMSCLMQETSATYEGRALTRLDVGLDGSVDGYLAKVGNYKEYFSNSPDLVFPQTWGPREIFFGVAAYERAKGASMTIVLPRDRSAWNGRMWVTAHGRGASFKQGQLKPVGPVRQSGERDRRARPLRPAHGGQRLRAGEDPAHLNRRPRRDRHDARGRLDGRLRGIQRHGPLHHGFRRRGQADRRRSSRPAAGAHVSLRPFRRSAHRPRCQLRAGPERRPRPQAVLRRAPCRRSCRRNLVSGGA